MYTMQYFDNDMVEFEGPHGPKVWGILAYKKANGFWSGEVWEFGHWKSSIYAINFSQLVDLCHKEYNKAYHPRYKFVDQPIEIGDRVLVDNRFGYVVDIAPSRVVVQYSPDGDYQEEGIYNLFLADSQENTYL
jgi:hypothetical protein